MDTYAHLIRAACFGDYRSGELSYARQLIAHAPDHSLTLLDRLYFTASFLLDWQHAGIERHWLMLSPPDQYSPMGKLQPVLTHARQVALAL